MPWVKVDDGFTDHPKVMEAGPAASWLYMCGLTYSARLLTDGFIPENQVRKLADLEGPIELAAKLVAVGLWSHCEGGYRIHDYHDYQPTAEKVKAERRAAAERMRKARSGEVRENLKGSAAELQPDVRENFADPTPSRPTPVTPVLDPVETPADPEDEPRDGAEVDTPYRVLEILCETTNRDIKKLTTREKNYSLAVAKRLLDDEVTCAEVRGFVGYLQSEHWRTGPITMKTIEDGIGTWRGSGAPASARASPQVQNGRVGADPRSAFDYGARLREQGQ